MLMLICQFSTTSGPSTYSLINCRSLLMKSKDKTQDFWPVSARKILYAPCIFLSKPFTTTCITLCPKGGGILLWLNWRRKWLKLSILRQIWLSIISALVTIMRFAHTIKMIFFRMSSLLKNSTEINSEWTIIGLKELFGPFNFTLTS